MFKLRQYQEKAHELIIEKFRLGLKTLLLMSTGAGKSKTIISFIKKYQKYYHFIIVVRRRGLVEQLEKDLIAFELEYGVFMADHPKYSPRENIQLCSVDTLTARGFLPHLYSEKDIVLVIDEADESNADGYQEIINQYTKRNVLQRPSHFTTEQMLQKIRPAFLLGMTATAFDAALPHFDEVIQPITADELRDQGSLLPFRYYIPSLIDLSQIRIDEGEFNSKDIERVFNSTEGIAADFKSWLKFGEDRQTLVFCTSQDHARKFAKYINDFYGKTIAVSIDANTPDNEREITLQDFKNGVIKFIVNVRLITRGVDIPEIGTILDSAPTLSINLHIQKIGRGSRPNNGIYSDCIVIDCANNCVNNGPFYKKREVNLKVTKKRTRSDLKEELRVCKSCFRGDEPTAFGPKNTCPFCGFFNGKIKEKKISKAKEKEIFLQNATDEQILQLEMINDFKKRLWKLENLGTKYPKNIAREKAHYQMLKTYGADKVKNIQKSIGISDALINSYKSVHDYVPLGGMEI